MAERFPRGIVTSQEADGGLTSSPGASEFREQVPKTLKSGHHQRCADADKNGIDRLGRDPHRFDHAARYLRPLLTMVPHRPSPVRSYRGATEGPAQKA